jgi:hypothetical protein
MIEADQLYGKVIRASRHSRPWCASAWNVSFNIEQRVQPLGLLPSGMSSATTPEGARVSQQPKTALGALAMLSLLTDFSPSDITIHYVSTSSAGSVCANRSSLFRCHRGLATRSEGTPPRVCC